MHLFLTGVKRVGKSTLLNAVLARFSGTVAGFRTLRVNTWLPGQYTVHLLPAAGNTEPGPENLLFVCGRPDGDTVRRFDALGCEALEAGKHTDLLVMDELGPHEAAAAGFQAAVREALAGRTPILGVLQQAREPFLKEIAEHPNVKLVCVTEENRDELYVRIPEFLAIVQKGGR